MTHVAWSVCLCVGRTDVLCKYDSVDRHVVWALTYVDPKNHVLDEVMGTGNIGSCPAVEEHLESCCGVRRKRDNSIFNNGTTYDAAFC